MKLGTICPEVDKIIITGLELVGTDRTDEEIRAEIERTAGGDESALEKALNHATQTWGKDRDYLSDRALRVFRAAARHEAVQPSDPRHAELFSRERHLNNMSPEDAVRELAGLSSEVQVFCDWIRDYDRTHDKEPGRREVMRRHKEIWKRVEQVLGPEAGQRDPLLRSTITLNYAVTWALDVSGVRGAMNAMAKRRPHR
jgi:hypothetical protein